MLFQRRVLHPIRSLLAWLGILVSFGATHGMARDTVRCGLADGFDFPVGKPDAKGYYKSRGFWPNGHLGEDWNGLGGGDSDLGVPIYSMGRGVVVLSEDVKVGWGNVVIIRHAYRDETGKIGVIDSLYGHLLERKVNVNQVVERGQLIGTMGSNRGMYPAHLHFEIRKNLQIGMNRSKFARDYSNYHSPTTFINANRQLTASFQRFDIPVSNFAAYGKTLAETQKGGSGRAMSIPVFPDNRPEPKSDQGPKEQDSAISEDDFWSRLKKKLSSGKVTNGDSNPAESRP